MIFGQKDTEEILMDLPEVKYFMHLAQQEHEKAAAADTYCANAWMFDRNGAPSISQQLDALLEDKVEEFYLGCIKREIYDTLPDCKNCKCHLG